MDKKEFSEKVIDRISSDTVNKIKANKKLWKKIKFESVTLVSVNSRVLGRPLEIASKISLKHYSKSQEKQVGDIVKFGKYNGDIEWIILDIEEEKMLLVSRVSIENMQFSHGFASAGVSWEESSVRNWLNESFAKAAFSQEQFGRIICADTELPITRVLDDEDDSDSGSDRIFLLSSDEYELHCMMNRKYFEKNKDGKMSSFWWLRTLGTSKQSIMGVQYNGDVSRLGYPFFLVGGIHPAMWLKDE